MGVEMPLEDPYASGGKDGRKNPADILDDTPIAMALRLQRLKLAETLCSEKAEMARARRDLDRAIRDFGQSLRPKVPPGG